MDVSGFSFSPPSNSKEALKSFVFYLFNDGLKLESEEL
jgi:hypothetical protein